LSSEANLHRLLDTQPANVNERVSPDDPARWGGFNRERYLGVGNSALRCIRLALLAADRDDPRTILDLPCGYGRVLRTLQAGSASRVIAWRRVERRG
jgi:hypothetical protein